MSSTCKELPVIVQGQRKSFNVLIRNKATGENEDLSNVTQVHAIHQLDSGGYLIQRLTDLAAAQIATVQAVADVSGSLNNRWFFYETPTIPYYFWMNVNGAGVDPKPNPDWVGVEIALATNATADDVASAIQVAADALATMGAVVATDTVTITNVDAGAVDDPVDGSTGSGTGFTLTVTTEGSDGGPVILGGTSKIQVTLSKNESPNLKLIAGGSPLVLSIDFPFPKGRQIIKIDQAYVVEPLEVTLP